jgi:hypothetical protein
MIGTPDQISDIIAIVGFTFAIVLLPALFNHKSFFPRWSSGLTATGLAIIGLCFVDLALWTAAASEIASTAVWLALFVWRGTPHAEVR